MSEREREIRARLEAATPGPWEIEHDDDGEHLVAAPATWDRARTVMALRRSAIAAADLGSALMSRTFGDAVCIVERGGR